MPEAGEKPYTVLVSMPKLDVKPVLLLYGKVAEPLLIEEPED